MATDPRRLKPGELCTLLNSTPLGEVIQDRLLREHRIRAGLRISDGKRVDLIRYVAWLVQTRHALKATPQEKANATVDLAEAAQGAAALASRTTQSQGQSQKLSVQQESLIAALLIEPTYAKAAAKVGVSEATLYRWMHLPAFRKAYHRARRELVDAAMGHIQAGIGQAVEALLYVTRQGRRDSDRVRAAIAVLTQACQGLTQSDPFLDLPEQANPMNAHEVVIALTQRLRQLEQANMPATDKARLTATLADSLLRAIGVDVLEKRLEAIESVLNARKESARDNARKDKKR